MKMEQLRKIYQKTDGYCHICHRKLSLNNYNLRDAKGAWHVEHSRAKSNGGSNHLNNLFPACISCNLKKGAKHTKTARANHGKTRAPYSRASKKKIKSNNTVAGAILGGLLGASFGLIGTVAGAFMGAVIGNENSPKK